MWLIKIVSVTWLISNVKKDTIYLICRAPLASKICTKILAQCQNERAVWQILDQIGDALSNKNRSIWQMGCEVVKLRSEPCISNWMKSREMRFLVRARNLKTSVGWISQVSSLIQTSDRRKRKYLYRIRLVIMSLLNNNQMIRHFKKVHHIHDVVENMWIWLETRSIYPRQDPSLQTRHSLSFRMDAMPFYLFLIRKFEWKQIWTL